MHLFTKNEGSALGGSAEPSVLLKEEDGAPEVVGGYQSPDAAICLTVVLCMARAIANAAQMTVLAEFGESRIAELRKALQI